jgi:uncharacterized membrane protein
MKEFLKASTVSMLVMLAIAITYVTWGYLKPVAPATVADVTTVDNKEHVVTKVVTTKKKDGTVVTVKDQVKDSVKKEVATKVVPQPKTKYTVGAKAVYNLNELRIKPSDYQLDIGRRLGQSDVWVEAGTRTNTREVNIGVRVEL